jgi:uncharacterized protein YeaO (DUF488 family)
MTTDVARNIRLKRIYETSSPEDGWRVLVTRYWPRGINRDSVDEYLPALGPSRSLLHSYRDGQLRWDQYVNQYQLEMMGELQQREIHRLAKLALAERVTVLCVCPDQVRCHRSLLGELISSFYGDA